MRARLNFVRQHGVGPRRFGAQGLAGTLMLAIGLSLLCG